MSANMKEEVLVRLKEGVSEKANFVVDAHIEKIRTMPVRQMVRLGSVTYDKLLMIAEDKSTKRALKLSRTSYLKVSQHLMKKGNLPKHNYESILRLTCLGIYFLEGENSQHFELQSKEG